MENRVFRTLWFALVVSLGTLSLLLSTNSWAQLASGQSKFLGNVINSSVPGNFSQFWNQVTPENAGKWGSVEGTRNQMNWSQLDLIYNFAQSNGYRFKGHTLVWGSQFPQWLSGLSAVEQRAEIEEWMQAFAARYPNTWAIDVVNEPVKTPLPWKAALGGDGATGWDWVITAFQLARQYFPDTRLLINEYGTENDPPARARYLTIINLLRERGLIDGIGVQAHYFNLDNMSAGQMTSALNDYAATGLDIYISELDITGGGTESAQAAKYQELFPAIWNHPSVKGVTLWGYLVGQTWRENSGLVNGNGTNRQAMTWLTSFLASTQNTLTVAPAMISLGAGASNSFVSVTSNATWNVTDNATWLAVSPATGANNGSLTVSATANTGAARSGTVSVTSGNLTRTIAVAQSGAITQDMLTVTPTTIALGSAAASAVVSVNSNVSWSVTDNATWLTASPAAGSNNGSFTLSASANTSNTSRSGTVTITGGSLMRTIAVTQGASTSGGGGAVTVTSAVTSASAWFNEQQVRISHPAPLTALSITVVIQRTPGLSVSGQYNTAGGQITQSSSSTAATLTYQFTLAPGQVLSAANSRVFAAQMGGTGTAHPTTGDTYTVTYTSGGQTFTQTGTF